MLWSICCVGPGDAAAGSAGATGAAALAALLVEASIGLAVIVFAASGVTVEPESSRRAAASSIHDAGDSAGAVGDVPANGSNTFLIRFAAMFATWTVLEDGEAGSATMTGVGAAV